MAADGPDARDGRLARNGATATAGPDRGALRRRAAAQGFVFTIADATACGWSLGKIRFELSSAAWCRLRRGVFAEAAVVERAGSDRLEQHRLRTSAALAAAADTWASHESAAAVLGLERLHWPALDRVQLTRPSRGPGRVRKVGDLDIHECALPPSQRSERRGVRTTSPARTVVDLARAGDVLDAVVVIDSAMRRFGLRGDDVAAVLQGCAGWVGTPAASTALELADPVSESVFESLSRVELTRRGLRPETQVWLAGPTGPAVRVDFLWWPQRTVGEADGLGKYAKYGSGNRLDPLQSEKLRQELLEEWGFEVVRWGYREMRREPDAVAQRVQRGYARSTVRQEIRARNGERELVRRLAAAPWDQPRFA